MRRFACAALAAAAAMMISSSDVVAQRGGGGSCGAGGGGGAARGPGMGAMTGGFGRGAGMTAGLTNNMSTIAMLSQMAQAQAMTQNRPQLSRPGMTPPGTQQRSQPRPTVGQFTRRAMQFDQNNDHQLDEDELGQVAVAVIRELQSQNRGSRTAQPTAARTSADRPSAAPSPQEMQDVFVARALDFDRNGDGMLSRSETSRMARALIRTLG